MRFCLPLEASQGNEHDKRGFNDATHSTQLNGVRTNWLNVSPVKRTRYHSISCFVIHSPYVSFARCVCFRTHTCSSVCVCPLCLCDYALLHSMFETINSAGFSIQFWLNTNHCIRSLARGVYASEHDWFVTQTRKHVRASETDIKDKQQVTWIRTGIRRTRWLRERDNAELHCKNADGEVMLWMECLKGTANLFGLGKSAVMAASNYRTLNRHGFEFWDRRFRVAE